jgi:hypothetical protein
MVAPKPGRRAYGIEISCEIYVGFEEMIYSVADHSGKTASYCGGVYIKEAKHTPRRTRSVESQDISPASVAMTSMRRLASHSQSSPPTSSGPARPNHATWNLLVEATQSKNA